ncbi:MAG: hypothetical protein JO125_12280 [Chloroflexi bacterium]|nr:hypothetical protein [Ktedonobacteraceae bacterium]MBV9708174.1 hypothetical protein [Chloroflexota bacterium]
MQVLTRPPEIPQPGSKPTSPSRLTHGRHRGPSPFMFIGIGVTLIIILAALAFFVVLPRLGTHAADAVNMDCKLIVPPNPLTAQGLATPYQLVAANKDNGPCHEANPNQAAFVQAAAIDPATGKISVYDPLVIDKGTMPAAAPVVPQLPQGAVVGIWFGFNGNNLTLKNNQGSLQQGNCVNGVNGSIFGQFAYCNAPAFFQAANQAIQAGKLAIPALGMAKDGKPCPSVRDFSIVDQDQSDNVTTVYLVAANGQTAQMNAANAAAMQNTQAQVNGSDNRLLAIAVDGALGCTPMMAPDLANPGNMTTALPLNELQAAAQQAAPIALVPAGDPMVLLNNDANLGKLNAYRAGVDQPAAQNLDMASTTTYCQNLATVAPQRLALDMNLTQNSPSPNAAMANNLFTFLAQRFATTFGPNGLNCTGLLHMDSPITVQRDGNGVAISAKINGAQNGNNGNNGAQNGNGNNGNNGAQNGNGNNGNNGATAPNCTVNGTAIAQCTGTDMINGQPCTLNFADNTVAITCNAAK